MFVEPWSKAKRLVPFLLDKPQTTLSSQESYNHNCAHKSSINSQSNLSISLITYFSYRKCRDPLKTASPFLHLHLLAVLTVYFRIITGYGLRGMIENNEYSEDMFWRKYLTYGLWIPKSFFLVCLELEQYSEEREREKITLGCFPSSSLHKIF